MELRYANLRLSLLLLTALLLLSFAQGANVNPVHAQKSAVVSVDPQNISDLSKSVGSNVTFQVTVANSPAITSFLVMLTFNSSVIQVATDSGHNPTVDFANNVLATTGASVITVVECANGLLILGNGGYCSPGTGEVALGLTILGSGQTTYPTTGLLFKVTFNVVGSGLSELHFYNALLFDATTASEIPISTSEGYFTNANCPSASMVFCTPPVAMFTSAESTFYAKTPILFNASSSRATNAGATILSYSWDWGVGELEQRTSTPTIVHTFDGHLRTYTVNLQVTDSYGTTASFTKSIEILPKILPPDFEVSMTSQPNGVIAGKTVIVPVNVTSVRNFSGLVQLNITLPTPNPLFPPVKLTAKFSTALVDLRSGSTVTTSLLITASKDSLRGYPTLEVTATSGAISHRFPLTVWVLRPQAVATCEPQSLYCPTMIIPLGQHLSFPIFVRSFYGFEGQVYLSGQAPTTNPNLTFTLSKTVVSLKANQTVALTGTIYTTKRTQLGDNYFDLLATTSEGSSHASMTFRILVPPLPPDFSINSPGSVRVTAGNNATLEVRVTSLNGFSGQVGVGTWLQPMLSGNDFPRFATNRLVMLSNGQTVVFTIQFPISNSTPPGKYTVAILARSPIGIHARAITLTIVPRTTDEQVDGHNHSNNCRRENGVSGQQLSNHEIGDFPGLPVCAADRESRNLDQII